MYSQLMKTLNASDGRYLTREEQEHVLAYCQSMPKRLQASAMVEQKELEIVHTVIEAMKRRYANFANLHDRAWEKGQRDVQLVLRYNVQGMIMDDFDMASDKLLFWFRTIVASTNMTPQFVRETYTFLREACKQKLPADIYSLLAPHLERTIEVMSDFPEPHRPAV